MKRFIVSLTIFSLLLTGLAAAQAPATTPAPSAAPQAAPVPAQPQCQMGPGGTCIMPGATPEQVKQMQGKMGQCCMMQPGQSCPMHQQMQKQLDELQKRVEALEGKKGSKK